jgi:diacylglycerol kinase (ATP)
MNNEFHKRIRSFGYAFNGFIWAFKTQKNLQIHIIVLILVVIFGIFLNVNLSEWIVFFICFALVISAELFNTALEKLTDIISPEYNEQAGKVKDLAAAAVLFSALISVICGLIIFVPKILQLL